jgi:hypothetical protein
MIRSVLAVLAGLVTLTVASFAIEAVANPLLMRLFPAALANQDALSHNVPAKLFMTAYTMLSVAFGGYITAWIANRSKALHAAIMGAIELVMTVGAMIALPGHAPLWSWLTGMVLMVPAAWLGGFLRAARTIPRDMRATSAQNA